MIFPMRKPEVWTPRPPEPEVCSICKGAGYLRIPALTGLSEIRQCECLRSEVAARRAETALDLSNLSAVAHLTFEAFDATVPGVSIAYRDAKRYAENPVGWLVLFGNVGTGKTHLAASIGHVLLSAGRPVVFQITPRLLDHLRATFSPESTVGFDDTFEALKAVEVLILDDLGAERATEWATEKLFQLVDHRYINRLPLVVTTNKRPEQFAGEAGKRIASRLFDQGISTAVAMAGADYRQRTKAQRKGSS